MITLLAVIIKHKRRIRLLFTNNLDASAFTSTLPYVVTNTSGVATDPPVVSVYAVGGTLNAVELALGADLVPSATYSVSAVGVVAVDASVAGVDAVGVFQISQPASLPNAEIETLDSSLLLYGRDLMFDGIDFVETANGDLARISGTANVESAMLRRLTGSPLPWAPQYSPNAREFVDSVDALPLRGRLREQALRDDRVSKAEAAFDASSSIFNVKPVLIGGHAPDPIPVAVKQ